MSLDSDGSIRSIARGMAVLQAINHAGSASLLEIASAAAIPHPTAVRIVRTLVNLGFIEREPNGKRYRPTPLVGSLSCGFQQHDRLAQAAYQPIVDLTQAVGWPITVSTRVGGHMVTRETTVAMTSLTFIVYQPGVTTPIFGSAAGEVWFAFAPPDEQSEILRHAEISGIDPLLVEDFISGAASKVIRERGYAVSTRHPQPKGSGGSISIAVPILDEGRVIGAVALIFFARTMSIDAAAARYLATLRDTADEISRAFHKSQQL